MSFLYPRLLAGQARPLHEHYQHLTIQELSELAETSHDSAVYVATGGDRVSKQTLQELREEVVGLAEQAGYPVDPNLELRARFDLRLATVLHSRMEVVPAEAASGDVWAFLALVLLPDVAYWRFPKRRPDRVLGTDLTRHVFGRMWWRAQLVHTPDDPDPYAALSILGESAFDQIYGRRKALGGSPHLVKGILRVWNGLNLHGLDERKALRNFLMRLLRLGPFVLFEALDESTLDAELLVAVRETVEALLSADGITDAEREKKIKEVFGGKRVSAPGVQQNGHVGLQKLAGAGASVLVSGLGGSTKNDSAVVAGDQVFAYKPFPYTSYNGPGFGDPREIGPQACAEALAAVVSVEGPVKATRAYRIITQLAGTRLREAAVSALVQGTRYAVRKGMLQAEGHRGRRGYPGSTLRLPDQPDWILRHRGLRKIDEIPDREMVAAASLVQSSEPTMDFDVLAKKTSLLFGYEKVSGNFKEVLLEALKKHGG